jgi:glycerol-3-phosphate acyltransferase PlsX
MAHWSLPSTNGATRSVRIAVDAMGGDHGPREVVPGAVDYALTHPDDRLLLVGREADIRAAVRELPSNVEIVPAADVIEMDEHPALALREKKDASILVACDLVRRGRADGVITAGHTGAGMAAAVLRLGRLPRVDRPALAVQLVRRGSPFVLLDIGANPDSTPENLAQYAQMGTIFAERVLGIAEPRVALLSIGEEKGKGDLRIQRATELLDASGLRFVGNVEGKDLTADLADVVVTDAVTGNVVIKFFEGLSTFIFDLWREQLSSGIRGKLAYLLLRPGIARIREVFDYERAGGSPLLGVKGVVIITHGRARRRMIGFGVEGAARAAREQVPQRIAEALREAEGSHVESGQGPSREAAPREASADSGSGSGSASVPPAEAGAGAAS